VRPHAEEALDELRLREQILRVAGMHDAALIEDDHVVGDPAHDTEVLFDE